MQGAPRPPRGPGAPQDSSRPRPARRTCLCREWFPWKLRRAGFPFRYAVTLTTVT